MPIPEDIQTRSGEPVQVLVDGRWLDGYIEFGDETASCISVATEPGGARIIVRPPFTRLRSDPGGKRPLRDSRGIAWPRA